MVFWWLVVVVTCFTRVFKNRLRLTNELRRYYRKIRKMGAVTCGMTACYLQTECPSLGCSYSSYVAPCMYDLPLFPEISCGTCSSVFDQRRRGRFDYIDISQTRVSLQNMSAIGLCRGRGEFKINH